MTSPVKFSLKSEIFPILLLVASVVLGFYFYRHFPDRVVTHWDFHGQPNGYSSRAVAALLMPAVFVGMYLLFLALPYLDPRRDRYQAFAGVYHLFKDVILSVLFVVFAVSGYANLGHAVKINIVIPVLIGLLFILLGNYMGKLKKNWFIGIRTPWTLSSENVWNRTHRVGGRLMAFFGVVVIVTPFLPKAIGTGVFLAGIILCVVGSFAYSYFAYRQEISGTGPTQNPDK